MKITRSWWHLRFLNFRLHDPKSEYDRFPEGKLRIVYFQPMIVYFTSMIVFFKRWSHTHRQDRKLWKFKSYPNQSLDEIENEIISDGVRRLSPLHQRPSGRRRSLSAEDNTSYWNRVFSSRDSEEIDSSEAQERFNKFVKKKWCYGKDPAKKGVIDQIEHSVAITVSEIIESKGSKTDGHLRVRQNWRVRGKNVQVMS